MNKNHYLRDKIVKNIGFVESHNERFFGNKLDFNHYEIYPVYELSLIFSNFQFNDSIFNLNLKINKSSENLDFSCNCSIIPIAIIIREYDNDNYKDNYNDNNHNNINNNNNDNEYDNEKSKESSNYFLYYLDNYDNLDDYKTLEDYRNLENKKDNWDENNIDNNDIEYDEITRDILNQFVKEILVD